MSNLQVKRTSGEVRRRVAVTVPDLWIRQGLSVLALTDGPPTRTTEFPWTKRRPRRLARLPNCDTRLSLARTPNQLLVSTDNPWTRQDWSPAVLPLAHATKEKPNTDFGMARCLVVEEEEGRCEGQLA